MDAVERSQGRQARFDASDKWLLPLAGVAVAIYLAELRGVWVALDVQAGYQTAALLIDLVFVVDLFAKLVLLGRRYARSVWCLIDTLSALPVLASLAVVPGFVEALRFIRGVRLFRMLRMLRTLRVLRSIRVFQRSRVGSVDIVTPESRTFQRLLAGAVLLYTGLFLGLMALVWSGHPQGTVVSIDGPGADGGFAARIAHDDAVREVRLPASVLLRSSEEIEYYFVLGSVLGMLLIVVVARAQLPAVASQQVRALLNVALPAQVADHFLQHPEDYDHTVQMPATVVFNDLRGFTATVEALEGDLDALKHHLEGALDAVVEVHRRYDLIVDKFIGDAIMSFRGGDLVSGDAAEHAWRVVRASIESVAALRRLGDPHFNTMRVGGASGDDLLIGTFGTSSRLAYTILGDRVNLAARLEAASKPLGTANLFCDRTRALTADRDDLCWRRVGRLRAQGKTEAVDVHEALDVAADGPWRATFEQALAAYEAGDLAAARTGFEQTLDQRPAGDGPARFYLEQIAALPAEGPPPGWSPVLALAK